MIKEIHPAGVVQAKVHVPGSKSLTNRALICAALASGSSRLTNASDSTDTALLCNGLNQLGVLVRKVDNVLLVEGTGGKLYAPKFPIPVGNAGTTLRFMLSLASLATGEVVFEADQRMSERPMTELLDALRMLGVECRTEGMTPRFMVKGGSLRGGNTLIRGNRTSQFLSSLLMAAPYARQDVVIEVEGMLSSTPYVDLTLAVMQAFDVGVEYFDRKWFRVKSGRTYSPASYFVEPDASAASYFLAAGAILGGEMVVEGLSRTLRQGDVAFAALLETMGAFVEEDGGSLRLVSKGALHGIDIDMNSMPDMVPTLAVTALFASGVTRIRNVAHLRFKESNRLEALETELKKLGANITLHEDGLEIVPAPLHGGLLDTYDDHRLAMSFALVGLRVPEVKIENPDCVRKSFPGFWKEFEKLCQNK